MSRFDGFCFTFLLIVAHYSVIVKKNFSEGTYWLLFAFIVYYIHTRRTE